MPVTLFTEIPIVVPSAPYARELLTACADLQSSIDTLKRLAAKANTMVTNNGDGTSNYNQIELQFGITTTPPFGGNSDVNSAGYNLLYQLNSAVGSNTNLTSAAVSQMLAQVG
jgi:hypothetical protein